MTGVKTGTTRSISGGVYDWPEDVVRLASRLCTSLVQPVIASVRKRAAESRLLAAMRLLDQYCLASEKLLELVQQCQDRSKHSRTTFSRNDVSGHRA